MAQFRSEAELAVEVVKWLADQGWDVYEEVQVSQGGDRADIVAVRNGLVWVVECKNRFDLSVIAQAAAWTFYAHAVSIAVPVGHRSAARWLGEQVCRERGIGVIYASKIIDGDLMPGRWGYAPPRLQRRANVKRLVATLSEGHKRYRAGTKGEYHTPWRQTCEHVQRAVKRRPGLTLKELVDAVDHHYASDAGCKRGVVEGIRRGWIKGLRLDTTKKPYRIYPEEDDGRDQADGERRNDSAAVSAE